MRFALPVASLLLASSLPAATIRGRVTECFDTVSAPGHVVKAFQQLTIGFPDVGKPCTIQTQAARLVGTDTTGADGEYSIAYTPAEDDPEFCLFRAEVFVQVFLPDGTTLAHSSAKKRAASSVTFNADVCPEPCPLSVEGPTVIEGEAGGTATFEVSVFLGAPPNGRFGGDAATLDFELAAIGADILGASVRDTAVETADSARTHIDPPNPFDPPNCPDKPVLTSVMAMDFEGVVGLPLRSGPHRVLRVTLQAVLPGIGQRRTATVYFPLDCQHVGTDCFHRAAGDTVSVPITRVRELDIELQGVEVIARNFRRADANASGAVDISDAIATFGFLFLGNSPPECQDAADSNGDGVVDISDGVNTLSFLFGGGTTIPLPGPEICGRSAVSIVSCESYDRC